MYIMDADCKSPIETVFGITTQVEVVLTDITGVATVQTIIGCIPCSRIIYSVRSLLEAIILIEIIQSGLAHTAIGHIIMIMRAGSNPVITYTFIRGLIGL